MTDHALRLAERATSDLDTLLRLGYAVDVRPDGPWIRATLRSAAAPAGAPGLVWRAAPTAVEAIRDLRHVASEAS